ncbi:hypothetical protein CDL15_Pgr026291 [Punica granatum]|uniref:Uncharacterized protein n=1 Tax=Punica granatum TaxID=22663 RepID=A0A218XWG4_PUNGR|nr:hypothetical protein CDL15_Pgr026291 [Punica granatum]
MSSERKIRLEMGPFVVGMVGIHSGYQDEFRKASGTCCLVLVTLGCVQTCFQARRGKHLHRLAAHYGKLSRGIPVPPLSRFFPALPQVIGGTFDIPSTEYDDSSSDTAKALFALPAVYAITEETSPRVHIRIAQEDEELANWTSVPCYSAMVANV